MRDQYSAVGFLFHPPTGRMLLQHRDGATPAHPNHWGLFGGGAEDQDGGSPAVTWRRELREELGVELTPDRVTFLWDYRSPRGRRRYVFYCEWPALEHEFILGEGQAYAWFTFDEALKLPWLIETARSDLARLRDHLGGQVLAP